MPWPVLPAMRFPSTALFDASVPTFTPSPALWRMVLPSPAFWPPTWLLSATFEKLTPWPPLPFAVLPAASVPMKLPRTALYCPLLMPTPWIRLPAITLRAPLCEPPMVFDQAPSTWTPSWLLATTAAPSAARPM